ncbi:2-oxoglutarate ferredoxin oxidoreductase subunit beta [archaeon]|nr:2-oxoglutarate ferredoxin oxidoreductase subunit beta [archaeon]
MKEGQTKAKHTIWCPGCCLHSIFKQNARALGELKLFRDKTIAVSGIGCSGRAAGYFNMDSVHGLHGRAVPLAEGIKLAEPELNVFVFSGDGDLAGIGLNHLIHAARRNTNIKVICINNTVYGMTGGQMAPTIKKGQFSITCPHGSPYEPLDIQKILSGMGIFYARTTAYHLEHLKECIKEAFRHEGFAFVEVIGYCITNDGIRRGYKGGYEMLMELKDYKIVAGKNELGLKEIGVVK